MNRPNFLFLIFTVFCFVMCVTRLSLTVGDELTWETTLCRIVSATEASSGEVAAAGALPWLWPCVECTWPWAWPCVACVCTWSGRRARRALLDPAARAASAGRRRARLRSGTGGSTRGDGVDHHGGHGRGHGDEPANGNPPPPPLLRRTAKRARRTRRGGCAPCRWRG